MESKQIVDSRKIFFRLAQIVGAKIRAEPNIASIVVIVRGTVALNAEMPTKSLTAGIASMVVSDSASQFIFGPRLKGAIGSFSTKPSFERVVFLEDLFNFTDKLNTGEIPSESHISSPNVSSVA